MNHSIGLQVYVEVFLTLQVVDHFFLSNKQMSTITSLNEYNNLMMEEIKQYHSVVKDFSNQSLSIKKLSITIYVTFLSLFFAISNQILSCLSFFVIGLSISLFCYSYEIYIDYVRQKMRRCMQNKIIEYERANSLAIRSPSKIIVKFFLFKLYRNDFGKIKFGTKSFKNVNKFYVNIVHSMYIIYFIEIGITILLGVLEF